MGALCRGRKTTLLPEPPGYLAWTNLCQEDVKWPVNKNLLTTPLRTILMSKSHQKHRRQILLPRRFPISISTLKTTYSLCSTSEFSGVLFVTIEVVADTKVYGAACNRL